MMESQIETMKNNIETLKTAKTPKEKKKKEKKEKAPVASTSKAPPKQPKASNKKKSKKNIADDDVLTFEQKKDLSETIGKLDGSRLERVIQIIHEGVPEIRDVSYFFFFIPFPTFPCPCTQVGSDHIINNRAQRKSSWRSTNYQRRCSRNCTTLSSDQSVSRPNQSAIGLGKALALVV
jgi:hypothetical protein